MISRKVVLHFPHESVDKPVVSRLVRDFRMEVNILKASIDPDEVGLMVVELTGEEKDFEEGLEYLSTTGITIQPLSQDIRRNDDRCSSCGACVSICPTEALSVDRTTMEVLFSDDLCVACELCVKVCPLHAMEIHY